MDDTGGLVYVVDDDASVRQALAGLVASVGLMAKTAAPSQELLDMVRPRVPCCVVLDVELPAVWQKYSSARPSAQGRNRWGI